MGPCSGHDLERKQNFSSISWKIVIKKLFNNK